MNSNEEMKAIEIVYNGNRLSLTKEQAVTLAQKGMNYDRLFEKFKEASAYKEKIDELAREAGTAPASIIGLLEKNIDEIKVSNYAENEKIPEEYAEKMMKLTREIEALKKEKEELLPIKKRNEELAEFKKEYPDTDVRELDKEIIDLWEKSDKSLTDIYNSVMLKKLLNKNEAEKANEQNKIASCGSVRDASTGEKIYTEDEIRKMSDEEIKRNFKTIARQLSKKEMNN